MTQTTVPLTAPLVMGILNLTPDSFSDGGKFTAQDIALQHAERLVKEGAQIIDIGGESTRPNAQPVAEQAELDRVMPIIEKVLAELPVQVSVDTYKAGVMRAAINAGVHIINDIAALGEEGSLQTVAASPHITVCLMHKQGTPQTMQINPTYTDVSREVCDFLQTRVQACLQAGITQDRIWLDPGFGFGKTPEHNLQLMNRLEQLTALGYPVLIGVSRKSLLGTVLHKPVAERLYGSLALAVLAISKGAKIVRTHDVAATVDVIKTAYAVLQEHVEA
ncbi:dihydropteroate synthase [Beggiatoa leptomitoformis]|uniref:Dihydropteroate synthase n=1 Tax=Beggiatoa leptomitoformis TaxID=288004 RepID=A0A2N9YF74_9GAMM|nr:dihydropteroate synthase [Beggiatoa leptomitoformis]ALG68521.2 dihydropteroate synthase [Beggiatoa leptomitoformis]AUI69138.2 dihydropteroate synthase [Beggiatoa leptomitoformis]